MNWQKLSKQAEPPLAIAGGDEIRVSMKCALDNAVVWFIFHHTEARGGLDDARDAAIDDESL